eukprot:7115340-Prorocentrum_lima.AAC.1
MSDPAPATTFLPKAFAPDPSLAGGTATGFGGEGAASSAVGKPLPVDTRTIFIKPKDPNPSPPAMRRKITTIAQTLADGPQPMAGASDPSLTLLDWG